ncbi:MAG: hypothetical protein PVI42_05240 [Desulfobacterales bacterium]
MMRTDISIDNIRTKGFISLDSKPSSVESATPDRRCETRKQNIFHLKCKMYNPESDTFELADTLAINYGVNGLYFEAEKPFKPGEPVCLTLLDQPPDTCHSEFAKGVHAQIVWCKPLNAGSDPRYGVGVKYFEPIERSNGW